MYLLILSKAKMYFIIPLVCILAFFGGNTMAAPHALEERSIWSNIKSGLKSTFGSSSIQRTRFKSYEDSAGKYKMATAHIPEADKFAWHDPPRRIYSTKGLFGGPEYTYGGLVLGGGAVYELTGRKTKIPKYVVVTPKTKAEYAKQWNGGQTKLPGKDRGSSMPLSNAVMIGQVEAYWHPTSEDLTRRDQVKDLKELNGSPKWLNTTTALPFPVYLGIDNEDFITGIKWYSDLAPLDTQKGENSSSLPDNTPPSFAQSSYIENYLAYLNDTHTASPSLTREQIKEVLRLRFEWLVIVAKNEVVSSEETSNSSP
jgi:hypothetical protein